VDTRSQFKLEKTRSPGLVGGIYICKRRRRAGCAVMQAMLGCAALGELRLAVPGMGYVGLVWGYERK